MSLATDISGKPAADLGAENLLPYPDGFNASELHDRLDLALRYISNWYRAVDGSDNQDTWDAQIDQLRAKVEAAEQVMNPAILFPGKAELATYQEASDAYTALYQQLQFSHDTLPSPGLIDQAADFLATVANTPRYLITAAADQVGRTLGDSAKQFIWAAWPFLAVAGLVGIVYIFRGPLSRLAGSVK